MNILIYLNFLFFILELIKNNYGNYVVQKALKISKNLPKKKIIFAILNNLEKINDFKLMAKWKNIILMNLPSSSSSSSSSELDKEDMEIKLLMIYGNKNVRNLNYNANANTILNNNNNNDNNNNNNINNMSINELNLNFNFNL